MYVKRYFSPAVVYFISWRLVLWSLFTGLLALITYQHLGWKWVAVPWLPISLIGTAVAFYVGFKTTNPTTEAGKPVSYGVESSTAAARLARLSGGTLTGRMPRPGLLRKQWMLRCIRSFTAIWRGCRL